MPVSVDITGEIYERLTVRGRFGSDKRGKATWLCDCRCGNTVVASSYALRSGSKRSCGCLHRESAAKNARTRILTPEQAKISKKRRIERQYERYLQKKFGISADLVHQMRAEQDDKCAICKQPFSRTPDLDHDHLTGKIRGLLCHACNLMLGLAKDNPCVLQEAAGYLESHAT